MSTSHIRPELWPQVNWWEGSSLLTVSKGGRWEASGGGARSQIRGFSADSRRRLMRLIGKVRRDARLPLFITLTWPERFPTVREGKRQFNAWVRRLKRAHPHVGVIWKLEPQERGAPHYHLLTWGAERWELWEWVPRTWYEIAGGGDAKHYRWHMGECGNGNTHCVQQVRTWRGVWSYAGKYLGKTFESAAWGAIGRYWGVINAGNIPFGLERRLLVPRSIACQLQRYQRRFAHLRHGRGSRVTTYCDAEQWVDRCLAQGRKPRDTECLAQSP